MSSNKSHLRSKPSRTSRNSNSQAPSLRDLGTASFKERKGSQTSLETSSRAQTQPPRSPGEDGSTSSPKRRAAPAVTRSGSVAGVRSQPSNSNTSLSGLVCNVHRTTGRRPPGLSGASNTTVGDKMYVFGGQDLTTRRVKQTMYELDMVRRHWRRLDATGEIPLPRYFHSMCALGDTKLVLFGGSTSVLQGQTPSEKGTMPLADVHIFDIETLTWTEIKTRNSPTPRYAHCATILPSSAIFTSTSAPLSALHHNPSTTNPNQGKLGVDIDGRGGAEMIIIGGQYVEEQYTDTVDVFNFRSLTWTSFGELGMQKCGAYRSVAATIPDMDVSELGTGIPALNGARPEQADEDEGDEDDVEPQISGAPAVFYNNYNFLNPNVEVKIRHRDGKITDMEQTGQVKPPGLRFPAAGVINRHLIVSGTFLRSSTEEYMLWALDLRTLIWHRIDIASGVFNSGSWNRGVPWPKRNAYIVLGDRARPFKQDYEKRRVNFKNICIVELEAFGLYDNPQHDISHKLSRQPSNPIASPDAAIADTALGLMEASDMELIAIDGERVPVNSNVLSQRWGTYFTHLMSEDLGIKVRQESIANSDAASLAPSSTSKGSSNHNRHSTLTITPANRASTSSTSGSTLVDGTNGTATNDSSVAAKPIRKDSLRPISLLVEPSRPLSLQMEKPVMRSRVLFLPHTYFTIRALVQYLYTGSLPLPGHHLCTSQILCSLLQIARPYCIQGLLEATVQRLHQVLDERNTAAVFNATAMAAGGGHAVKLAADPGATVCGKHTRALRNAANGENGQSLSEDDSDETDTSISTSSSSSPLADVGFSSEPDEWTGEFSAIIGLQKRALRGLMEGKRMREKAKAEDSPLISPGVA